MQDPRRLAIVLLLIVPAMARSAVAAGARDAAAYLPADVDAFLVLRDGDRQVTRFRGLLATHRFADTPLARQLLANPELLQGRMFLAGVADAAGTDPWSAAGSVLGRELAVGIRTGAGRPTFLAVAVPRDPGLAGRVLDTVHTATGLTRNGRPNRDRVRTIAGRDFLELGDGLVHGRLGDVVLIGNDRALVEAAVATHEGAGGGLAASPRYAAAKARVPADAAAFAAGDPTLLRAEGTDGLPNPLAAVLGGGWWDALGRGDDAVVAAVPGDNRLRLLAGIETATPPPATHRGFAPASVPTPDHAIGPVPGQLARLTVRRDFESLFAERESVMTLPAASDFVNFTNTLTTLLGQVDFVDEVLARVNGPVELIAARRNFPAGRVPDPLLPAFALVIPLEVPDDDRLRDRLHSGALSAIAVLNVDAAQNGRPTFLLDIVHHAEHRIVTARYPEPAGDGGPLALAHNFAPSAVALPRHFVVATSPDLLRAVIDARDPADPHTSRHPPADRLVIDAAAAVALLAANRETLVVNSMLEKDKPRATAESEIDTLLALLGYAHTLELATNARPDRHAAELTLTLRPPPAP